MKNNSNVPIDFKITLDSSNESLRKEAENKRFLYSNDPKYKPAIGPNNHSGQAPFDIFPLQGTIQAGSKLEFKVFFSPDHTSELFADIMRISMLSTTKNSRMIQLNGKSRKSNIYVKGVENLTANLNTESVILTDIDPNTMVEGGEKDATQAKGIRDFFYKIPNLNRTKFSLSSFFIYFY